jgi:hypothetical protein
MMKENIKTVMKYVKDFFNSWAVPIAFIVMVFSIGISVGLTLRGQFTMEYFEFLVPLIYASYVSTKRFYKFVRYMNPSENGFS